MQVCECVCCGGDWVVTGAWIFCLVHVLEFSPTLSRKSKVNSEMKLCRAG